MSGLKFSHEGSITIIETEHYLDISFKQEIEAFFNRTAENVTPLILLFNLANVKIVNTHGATTFYRIFEKLQETGGKMAICCINSTLVEANFRDLGMYRVFGDVFFSSFEEARRFLLKQNNSG